MANKKKVVESVATETPKPAVKKQSLQDMLIKLKTMVNDDLTEFNNIAKIASGTNPDLKNIGDIANSAVKAIKFFIDNFDNDMLTKPVVNDGLQVVKLLDPGSEAYNKLVVLSKVKSKTGFDLKSSKEITDLLFDGKPVGLQADLIKELEDEDDCKFEQTDEPSAYTPSEELSDSVASN